MDNFHLYKATLYSQLSLDFTGGAGGKELACWRGRLKRPRFPGPGPIPWRRGWQPSLVTLPRESRGQRRPAGCRTESDTTDVTEEQQWADVTLQGVSGCGLQTRLVRNADSKENKSADHRNPSDPK